MADDTEAIIAIGKTRMKFVIKKKEDFPTALRRIACEQLQIAAEHASGVKPSATSVHCARKAIKRARAVLKLARCGSNRLKLKRQDEALRDAAKLLAPNRDLHVQEMALKRLPICKRNGTCAIVWKRLRAKQQNLQQHPNGGLKEFGAAINTARSKIPDWNVNAIDSTVVVKSLERTYRRARKRYKAVCRISTGEKMHRWRKTAKTFWHQLQLVDRFASKKLCALCRDAERLAKVLGDEHDLFMLLTALREATDPDSRAVKHELRQLRAKLTRRALKLGRKTFDLAPSAFHKRLSHCVK